MVEMKSKDEIISISLGDIKYFYKAALLATEKQDSGIVVTEGQIPDTTVTEYYATLASVKTYKSGKVDGDVKVSDVQTNTVVLHETYKEGALEGTKDTPKPAAQNILEKPFTFTRSLFERVFYTDGKETTRQVLDKNGVVVTSSGKALTGSAKEFYPNGSLKREAFFKDGMPEGSVKIYDIDGRLSATENYKNGVKEGLTKRFNFIRGILTEELLPYQNGKINGKRQVLGVNGKVVLTEEYKDDIRNGVKETFYMNGNTESKAVYENNVLNGPRIFFYENGKVLYTETLVNGMIEGKRTGFYPDGSIYLEENYKHNLLDGEKTLYDENGKVKSREFYKDGVLSAPGKNK